MPPAVPVEHLPGRRRRGRARVLHRRGRSGRAADRGGRAARALADATCCSPTTTSTTSARSKLRERWPGLAVLISARERELLGSASAGEEGDAAERGRGAGSRRSRPGRRCASGRSRCAPCARPVTPPECCRSSSDRGRGGRRRGAASPQREHQRPGGLPGEELWCSRATRCSRTPSAASGRPATPRYTRPARLDHGHAHGAAARDRHLPGPRRRDVGRARSGTGTPSSASGAASTPRAPSRARRSGEPATLVLLGEDYDGGTRRGCAGRTARTTSCRARACRLQVGSRARRAATPGAVNCLA